VGQVRKYDTAVRRWEGVGPYYAMFPTHFADSVVSYYTKPGETVLDPFAGRGTAVFSAAHQGRRGLGIEINPVGWIYAKAKLDPAPGDAVAQRLLELDGLRSEYREDALALPPFFHSCFSQRVCEYLLAARQNLEWRDHRTDRTMMALLLIYLHGKRDAALSNQMRQTKSMAPDYAVRWWRERRLNPPEVEPVEFMTKRLEWRYAKGLPTVRESQIYLGDSERQLPSLTDMVRGRGKRVRLLLTSPPYFALTNYHYDQWLRLWLLGGPPTARRVSGTHELKGKFEGAARYKQLLQTVFENAADLLSPKGVVYVRTGLGAFTHYTTQQVLEEVFPRHRLEMRLQPYSRPTQTSLFGDPEKKAGEVDLVMTPA
jgi:hypothetical protein